MAQPIRRNDAGERVRTYQQHLNERLRARDKPPISVTGTCDGRTINQSAFAAWFLGATGDTIKAVQNGTIGPGLQAIVSDPDSRDDAQRERAQQRRGKHFPGHRRVLVQAGHLSPREPGLESATGTNGEQEFAKAVRDNLVALLDGDGRFDGIPVPGDIPDGIKVDAALFLHADGAGPTARGFHFGFPVTDDNRKLVRNLREEFLALPGHPVSRGDNATDDASEYYGFSRVRSRFKVLVEHGFLTNPTERQWLNSNIGKLARAEYEALCRTFALTPVAA